MEAGTAYRARFRGRAGAADPIRERHPTVPKLYLYPKAEGPKPNFDRFPTWNRITNRISNHESLEHANGNKRVIPYVEAGTKAPSPEIMKSSEIYVIQNRGAVGATARPRANSKA